MAKRYERQKNKDAGSSVEPDDEVDLFNRNRERCGGNEVAHAG